LIKKILIYGLLLGAGIFLLKFIEYKYLVLDHSLEIYGGLVALIFIALGLWAGNKLSRKKTIEKEKIVFQEKIVEKEVVVKEEIIVEKEIIKEVVIDKSAPFSMNSKEMETRGISKREYEVLELMSQGLSNQEIADKLFISLSTVKTHSSNLLQKLGAERRTQAIQNAKSAGLIP
jgi:two-component system, NarL family, response regulator LiaR